MAINQSFIDSVTVIQADWLNHVNQVVNGIGTITTYTPEYFGANGSNTALASAANKVAFQAAIDAGAVLVFPGNKNYVCDAGLKLRPGTIWTAQAYANGSGTDYANFPASRIIFLGSGTSGFINNDTTTLLNQGALLGLTIQSDTSAHLPWLFDVNGMVSWAINGCRMEQTWTSGGGFRSHQIVSDPTTWLNRFIDTQIRVPDASTAQVLDIDWSDSNIFGGVYTGGIGSIYRGPGNVNFITQFERANAGGAGLTLSKELTSVGTVNVQSIFDSNVTGLKVTAASNPGGTDYVPYIRSVFRNPGSATDIVFDSTGISSLMQGPVIAGSTFAQPGVTPWSANEAKWQITVGINNYVDTTWTSTYFGDTAKLTAILAREGINLYGAPAFVRNSQTFRGAPNVAAGFGANLTTSPMLIAGAISGVTPFVGASKDSAGVAQALAFVTNNAAQMVLSADGSIFYPQTDLATAFGTHTQRWTGAYSQKFSLTNGATAPGAETNVAHIYIDVADGAPKIKYPSGTVKTFTIV